jgi:hypothetical protein
MCHLKQEGKPLPVVAVPRAARMLCLQNGAPRGRLLRRENDTDLRDEFRKNARREVLRVAAVPLTARVTRFGTRMQSS